jgi:hypothetical protein
MNAKKRKEKEIKRGYMTADERHKIRKEKMDLNLKRKIGKKYKKPFTD